jgi:hypothetical protein
VRNIAQIHMMPDFMHEDVAQVESAKRIQIRASERISMKKYAGVPVMATKRVPASPAFQLLDRARQDKDSAQAFQEIGGATFQLGFHFLCRARLDKSFESCQLDNFWERGPFRNSAVKTFEDRLNLQPPRFILSPIRESIF